MHKEWAIFITVITNKSVSQYFSNCHGLINSKKEEIFFYFGQTKNQINK